MVTSLVTTSPPAPAWSGHFTFHSGAVKSRIPDTRRACLLDRSGSCDYSRGTPDLEAMMAHRIVGQPLGKLEGSGKVSGQARSSGDVTLPGLIWGKALRSPLPHARIRRVDTSRAKALPGVLTVLTAQDLPDILVGRRMFDMPMLARDRVRFVGE